MKKTLICELDDCLIKEIKSLGQVKSFNEDHLLLHSKQVPIAAIALIKGSLFLKKDKLLRKLYTKPCIVGHKELMQNLPFHYDIIIPKNSQICYLTKSDLLEILSNQCECSSRLKQMVETSLNTSEEVK